MAGGRGESGVRRLAFYVVPGHVTSAAPVAREVTDGAQRGFGAVLRALAEVYPESWLRDGAAIGDAKHCAYRARQQLDAGADRVILHGNAPADLDGVLTEFRSGGR